MTATSKTRFKRTLQVCYPAGTGTLVVRTDSDWDRNLEAVDISSDGNTLADQMVGHIFRVENGLITRFDIRGA